MPKTSQKKPADFITPLNMNGLHGRMLRMPAPKNKKREFLLIYGHHASLERLFGLAETLNDFGGVTMPDLPGFGGMESFYKLGETPTLDIMADYLAAFIKLHCHKRRVTVVGLSYGFLVLTRTLQRYPELAKKVDLAVSIVGFARSDEFNFSRPRYLFYRWGASFFSHRLTATFFRYVVLHPLILSTFYGRTHNAKQKFVDLSPEVKKRMTEFEIHLWHCNDVRTYMSTTVSFLTADNCKQQIDLPLWHVSVKADHYFNNAVVEQHLQVIYKDFHSAPANFEHHSMTIIADKKASAPFVPRKLRTVLNKNI